MRPTLALALVFAATYTVYPAAAGAVSPGEPGLPADATPLAAPAAPTPTAADTALLEPILAALGAAQHDRAALVPHIIDSADPRAVAPLRYAALHDRARDTVEAAVAALGRLRHATAVTALVDIATGAEDSKPNPAALDALSQHALVEGVDALYTIAKDADHPSDVRRSAMEVLQRDHPAFVAAHPSLSLGGSALTATLGGGYFGGFALASVGDFAGNGSAGPIGWVAGSIIGAGTGYILGRQVSNARQHYYFSAMGWGAAAGTLGAYALVAQPVNPNTLERVSPDESGLRRVEAGLSLLGELGGLGLGWLAADRLNFSSADVLVTDLAGLAAMVGSFGVLGFFPRQDDERPGFAALLAGSLAGVGLGVATAQNLHFSAGDVGLTLLGTAECAYAGGWLVETHTTHGENAGAALGIGLGAIGSAALAQYVEPTVGNVTEMLVFSSYGKILGLGLAAMGDLQSQNAVDLHLALGAVGLGAGAWLGTKTTYSGGDRAIVPIGTVLGLGHGLAFGAIAADQNWARNDGNFVLGMTLTGAALGGLGGLALGQGTNISNWQVTMGSSGAVWGAWLSGWGLALSHADISASVAAGVWIGGTDLGLAATSLLISPLVELDPRVIAGANFGGMAGAGLFSLFTAMFSNNTDNIIKANLAGSAIGLVSGALVARAAIADTPLTDLRMPSWAPAWLRNPIKTVQAAPHLDAAGRYDGMTLNAVLDVLD